MVDSNGNERLVPLVRPLPRARYEPIEHADVKRDQFVQFVRDGCTLRRAAAEVEVPINRINQWRRDIPWFGEAVSQARELARESRTEEVEDALYAAAISGEDTRATETWLRAHRPEMYQEKLRIEHTIEPSSEDLARYRELSQNPEFVAAAQVFARTYGMLDDPDVVDEDPA